MRVPSRKQSQHTCPDQRKVRPDTARTGNLSTGNFLGFLRCLGEFISASSQGARVAWTVSKILSNLHKKRHSQLSGHQMKTIVNLPLHDLYCVLVLSPKLRPC
jgi:hypothetical protein